MITIVIYILAGITYSVMLLLLDDIATELNVMSEKLGKELDPLRVDLKGKPMLILIIVIFWPVLAVPTIYKKIVSGRNQ